MSIAVACPCGKQLRVNDALAGKRVKCPACGGVLAVPAAEGIAPATIPLAPPPPEQPPGPVPPAVRAARADERDRPGRDRPRRPRRRRRLDEEDREATPSAAGAPWYLLALAALPLGIPLITLGGLIPCVVGFGLAGACLGVARKEDWPVVGRLLASLGLTAAGYAALGAFLVALGVIHLPERGAGPVAKSVRPADPAPPPNPAAPAGNQAAAPPPPPPRPAPLPPHRPMDPGGRLFQAGDLNILTVAFSPDDSTLLVASPETLSLWDPATGENRARVQGGGTLAYAPDGKKLVCCSNNQLTVWDPSGGTPAFGVGQVAVAPDGRHVVASDANSLQLYDFPGGRKLEPAYSGQGTVSAVAYAPDGRTVAVATTLDPGAALLDADTLRVRLKCGTDAPPGLGPVAFLAGGRRLALASLNEYAVRVCDAATGKTELTLKGDHAFWSLAVSPDGSVLAGGDEAGAVWLWDPAAGQELAVLRGGVPNEEPLARQLVSRSLAFSHDGKRLAAGAGSGHVRVWDVGRVLGRVPAARK